MSDPGNHRIIIELPNSSEFGCSDIVGKLPFLIKAEEKKIYWEEMAPFHCRNCGMTEKHWADLKGCILCHKCKEPMVMEEEITEEPKTVD